MHQPLGVHPAATATAGQAGYGGEDGREREHDVDRRPHPPREQWPDAVHAALFALRASSAAMTTPGSWPLPRNLVAAAAREGRTAWLGTLPTTAARIAAAWSLTIEAPFQPGGQTAWVAPVRNRAGERQVLKLAWRHPETEHEADALDAWAGHGAVRLHAAADSADTIALLLERCRPGTPLTMLPETEQDEVVAGLLPRLWCAPPTGHRFRSLQAMCEAWAEEFDARVAASPTLVDPGLARAGISLFLMLPTTAEHRVLLATDLHAGNVLAAEREPWLAIDPNPYVGDPTYDPLQHLLNCTERLHADPAGVAGRIAGLLGLEPLRLRRWLFARCVQESLDQPLLADVARRLPID
jgi:streptomycin 6-kinase